MRFTSFKIDNFRGITSTTMALSHFKKRGITALVGLNESGKTTVLEALHNWRANPNLLRSDPSQTDRTPEFYQSMIPIGRRHLFNDIIRVQGEVQFDHEWTAIANQIKEQFKFAEVRPIEKFTIAHEITYENSEKTKQMNLWSSVFYGRGKGKTKKWVRLPPDDWLKCTNFIEPLLPKIVYFPATLLEFPDEIVLEAGIGDKETRKNSFYCDVVADILRSIDPKLSIQSHLIARARSGQRSDKENVDALLLRMERVLKETVVKEWRRIFNQSLADKEFKVELDLNAVGRLALRVKVREQDGLFSINERSAGFRWFFAYILLTQYRIHRGEKFLFLFDEPAANLHPNAQSQLLKNFASLAEAAQVIYTTHSHHLINPLWLDATHVVANSAIDETVGFDPSQSQSGSIAVTPYRHFVGQHPDQSYYYRPIMEALDYAPSSLEFPSKVVLLEGKTDFYGFKYFFFCLGNTGSDVPNLFPGGGAGSLDPLISLLSGWGKEFIIVVDSDAEGEKQKARYLSKFERLVEGRLFALGDLDSTWQGLAFEKLIAPEDLELIRKECFPDQPDMTKKVLHRAVLELSGTKRVLPFTSTTLDNFSRVRETLSTLLSALDVREA